MDVIEFPDIERWPAKIGFSPCGSSNEAKSPKGPGKPSSFELFVARVDFSLGLTDPTKMFLPQN